MDTNEIAWLAGLFEGEGCVTFHGKNEVHLAINLTDKDVLERAYKLSGSVGSFRHYPSKNPNHKDSWNWCVAERDQVKNLIQLMLPWMGVRRTERMQQALCRLKNNRGINKVIEHGTLNGYRKEMSRGIGSCAECRKAYAQYRKELKSAKSI